MIPLARQYAAVALSSLNGPAQDAEGSLTDESDEAIDKVVASLTKDELFELIWTTESVDGDLLGYGAIDDNDPRVMLRMIATLCIRDSVLLLTLHWDRRHEVFLAAKARWEQRVK